MKDLKAAGMPANEAQKLTFRDWSVVVYPRNIVFCVCKRSSLFVFREHFIANAVEASRINQYNMFLFKNFEKLWSTDLMLVD